MLKLILTAFLISYFSSGGNESSAQQSTSPGHIMFTNTGIEEDINRSGSANGNITFKTAIHQLNELFNKKQSGKLVLGHTKKGLPVEAYYFPGKSDKRAMVVGGMHGSELSSIFVAKQLIRQLENEVIIDYHVLIIPSLFPDNAAKALQYPSEIGGVKNIGRYTNDQLPDPNRQMPALGRAFKEEWPFDSKGRIIEKENQWLLQTVQFFQPEQILNIHAIRDISKAGVFADPRTDAEGISLGFDYDSVIAVKMADFINARGGCVQGNQLQGAPSAIYHNDFTPAPKGEVQLRNLEGSKLPGARGAGVSFGSWASTAVADHIYARNAIRLITMEFPGYKRPEDYEAKEQQDWCLEEVERYASSISQIFLKDLALMEK